MSCTVGFFVFIIEEIKHQTHVNVRFLIKGLQLLKHVALRNRGPHQLAVRRSTCTVHVQYI